MTASLLDTNLLVYAYDATDSIKHERALKLFKRMTDDQSGVLSSQNLIEFGNAMLKKVHPKPNFKTIHNAIEIMVESFDILLPNDQTVSQALTAVERFQISYWDALIWAIAKQHAIPEILTEDLPGGRSEIDGIAYRNPLQN